MQDDEVAKEEVKSKKFKITAGKIKALLSKKYESVQQFASAAEVGCQTGWASRRMDFMVMHCWEGEFFEIEAFEIKISKSDLKRELMDPSKHNVFFDEIDKYWIVAPDFVLDDLSIIPKSWGVLKVVMDGDEPVLKTARKPIALHDEQAKKRLLSRPFVASLCRAINLQSATKCRLYEEQQKMLEDARRKVEEDIAGGAHVVPDWKYKDLERCFSVCKALGLDMWHANMTDEEREEFRRIRQISKNFDRLDGELQRAEREIKYLRSNMRELMKADEVQDVTKGIELGIRELYVVTFVEYGESVDGCAYVQGVYTTLENAKDSMRKAAEGYKNDLQLERMEISEDTARVGDCEECGCVLKIETIGKEKMSRWGVIC